ncbi:MAG TPA: hypothetical protein PKD85_23525, partial [Saprospiraceae bacterium]|nr:hypothetical protein [Saprospiraceae bacterium]
KLIWVAIGLLLLVLHYELPQSTNDNYSLLDNTYHNLWSNDFYQDWSDIGMITTDNDWGNVPSIIGYGGALPTTATGRDPQTILEPFSDIFVRANQTNVGNTTGGVFEFHIPNPTVAIQPSSGADAPNIVLHINTMGVENLKISYRLRDIDNTIDNAIQPVALQY